MYSSSSTLLTEEQWISLEDQIEVYVVVQRGTKIGFFEYHNDITNLDEEEIPHFGGCISLTQSYQIDGIDQVILDDVPKDLDLLYHNIARLRTTSVIRKEAEKYTNPCLFDLDKHEKEINFLYHHMANNPPRSSI